MFTSTRVWFVASGWFCLVYLCIYMKIICLFVYLPVCLSLCLSDCFSVRMTRMCAQTRALHICDVTLHIQPGDGSWIGSRFVRQMASPQFAEYVCHTPWTRTNGRGFRLVNVYCILRYRSMCIKIELRQFYSQFIHINFTCFTHRDFKNTARTLHTQICTLTISPKISFTHFMQRSSN